MKIVQIADGGTIWFAELSALEQVLEQLDWLRAPFGFGVFRVSEPEDRGDPPDPYIELCAEISAAMNGQEIEAEADEDPRIAASFEYREDLNGDWTLSYA